MFLSRTVAAEICMESKSNESAYRALKILDRTKELLFDLSYVYHHLRLTFILTSLTYSSVVAELIKVNSKYTLCCFDLSSVFSYLSKPVLSLLPIPSTFSDIYTPISLVQIQRSASLCS